MKNRSITIIAVLVLVLVGLTIRYIIKSAELDRATVEMVIDSKISTDSLLQIQYNDLKLRIDSLELRLSEVTDNLNRSDSTLYDKLNSLEKSLNSLRKDFVILRDVRIFNYHD